MTAIVPTYLSCHSLPSTKPGGAQAVPGRRLLHGHQAFHACGPVTGEGAVELVLARLGLEGDVLARPGDHTGAGDLFAVQFELLTHK